MKQVIKLLLLFMPLISFGQDYEIDGDTIIIHNSGEYRYSTDGLIRIGDYFSTDTLYFPEPTEEEKVQKAIEESSNIIYLMGKYMELTIQLR